MTSDLSFTGERFLPGCSGEIAYEHWHRYAFARLFTAGKRVLDAASGEGYGTALLAQSADAAFGLDIDFRTVAHATAAYRSIDRACFVTGSCDELPFADSSFDVVVSFETVEHLAAADQPRMVSEFARVLKTDGVLVFSSPNKAVYSDERQFSNEFHIHELYREGLEELLAPHFPAQQWWRQRVGFLSGIWRESDGQTAEAWLGDRDAVHPYVGPEAMYFLVVAAKAVAALPRDNRRLSVFADRDDSEMARAQHHARETLRLDALLKSRDESLNARSAHISHLESLLAEHQRVVVQRDADVMALEVVRVQQQQELARCAAATTRLQTRIAEAEAALTAQERIIAYRQSGRWWLELPWLRLRRWWADMRA